MKFNLQEFWRSEFIFVQIIFFSFFNLFRTSTVKRGRGETLIDIYELQIIIYSRWIWSFGHR